MNGGQVIVTRPATDLDTDIRHKHELTTFSTSMKHVKYCAAWAAEGAPLVGDFIEAQVRGSRVWYFWPGVWALAGKTVAARRSRLQNSLRIVIPNFRVAI